MVEFCNKKIGRISSVRTRVEKRTLLCCTGVLCLISVQYHLDNSAEIDCLKILSIIMSKSFFTYYGPVLSEPFSKIILNRKIPFTYGIRSRVYLGTLVLFNLCDIKDNKPGIENILPFQHHFSPNQLALRALHIAFHHSKVLPPT